MKCAIRVWLLGFLVLLWGCSNSEPPPMTAHQQTVKEANAILEVQAAEVTLWSLYDLEYLFEGEEPPSGNVEQVTESLAIAFARRWRSRPEGSSTDEEFTANFELLFEDESHGEADLRALIELIRAIEKAQSQTDLRGIIGDALIDDFESLAIRALLAKMVEGYRTILDIPDERERSVSGVRKW